MLVDHWIHPDLRNMHVQIYYRYVAFIDLDEMIVPVKESRLMDLVESLDTSGSNICGFSFQCKTFALKRPNDVELVRNYPRIRTVWDDVTTQG